MCWVGPWLGENQWEGTLPYTEMAQWEGEEGVKILSFLLFFFKLKNDAFVFPRERKSKDEEIKKNEKKTTLLNIF